MLQRLWRLLAQVAATTRLPLSRVGSGLRELVSAGLVREEASRYVAS